MSCKCKNIIENFQGGTIPLDTTFLGNVDICNTGSTLSVSNIIGCSPITIGSDSGCTSGNTTLIVSGSSVFSCDIDVLGGIYSGGTNLIDIFSSGGGDLATVLAAGNTTGGNNITMSSGDAINSANGGGIITLDDGNVANSIAITTDNGSYLESWQFMDPTSFQLGFGSSIYATISSSGYDFLKTDVNKDVFVVQSGRFSYTNAVETGGYTNVAGSIVSTDLGVSGATANNDGVTGLFLNSGRVFGGGSPSTYNSGVFRSVAVGGEGLTVKTSETAYANQISLQPSGNNFDGLLVPPTLTADRSYSFQDASGTVAFLSDITPYVTGGTYISSASTINFTNTDGGTFSVTGITSGGGSSSGVVGISDATGTYTYYNNLNEAISAATAGQVVELFADIEETGTVSINLKGGVDINFNGHSYTLNETTGVPNVFNTSFMSDGDEVHMWNGKINRIGSLNFTTGVGFDENRIVANTVANVSIYWHDCVLECSNGGFIYASKGSFYGGTYLNYHPTATASWGLIHTSTGGSAKFYDFRLLSKRIMCLKNYGGKFYNCNFYNEGYIACGLYNTAAEFHNCHSESDGHSALIGSNGFVYNSFFKSTSNQAAMDFGGTLWNCTGIASASNGLKANYSSSKAYNCTGKSATNYGLSIGSQGATIQGGLFLADSANHFLTGGNTIGVTLVGGTNGDCVQCSNGTKISGCNLVVRNTSKNAINGIFGNPATVHYVNNTIIGNPTVPINANVTQQQTTTHDTFGNIVLD